MLRAAREDMHAAIDGLPTDALNWRPAGQDSNSIAALATHALGAARYWLGVAAGEPPPRDRPSEFQASAEDAEALSQFVDEMVDECLSIPDRLDGMDWAALRAGQPGLTLTREQKVPAALCLVHALEHLREHVGQMMLTRQLWEQRSPP